MHPFQKFCRPPFTYYKFGVKPSCKLIGITYVADSARNLGKMDSFSEALQE